jgi:cold shock CspA family protein
MEGVVRSYVAERRFGFIDGEDGKSYFFHANAFLDPSDQDAPLDGAILTFEPTATPKGLAAKRLALARDRAELWEPLDEFLVTRGDGPHWGEIMAIGGPITVQGPGSPDDLRSEIRQIAVAMDANALIGLRYSKSTGQSGNYRFSIHQFSATPVVLMRKRPTRDLSLLEASDRRLKAMVDAFMAGEQDYRNHLAWLERTRSRRGRIRAIALTAILSLVLAGTLSGHVESGQTVFLAIFISVVFAIIPINPDPTWPRRAKITRGKLRGTETAT